MHVNEITTMLFMLNKHMMNQQQWDYEPANLNHQMQFIAVFILSSHLHLQQLQRSFKEVIVVNRTSAS